MFLSFYFTFFIDFCTTVVTLTGLSNASFTNLLPGLLNQYDKLFTLFIWGFFFYLKRYSL